MKWFSEKAVCSQCGCYFKPDQSKYGKELCREHRKPNEERDARIALVAEWAREHWEELEPQATEWHAERTANFNKAMLSALNSQSQSSPSQLHGLGNVFGLK